MGVAVGDIRAVTDAGQLYSAPVGDGHVFGCAIDVAGENFGCVAVLVDEEPGQAERLKLDIWCEEIDNYLAY